MSHPKQQGYVSEIGRLFCGNLYAGEVKNPFPSSYSSRAMRHCPSSILSCSRFASSQVPVGA